MTLRAIHHALVLAVLLAPLTALGQVVTTTYGLGGIHERLCTGAQDDTPGTVRANSFDCQILLTPAGFDPADPEGTCPTPLTPGENRCAARGPDTLLSSGLQIQSDQAFPIDLVPGTVVLEEDLGSGTSRIPEDTESGWVNIILLDLDLGFGTYLIPSSLSFALDGAEGIGTLQQNGFISWANPSPYQITGCLTCISGSGLPCAGIGLGPPAGGVEGDPICDGLVQPNDPRTRPIPDFVSDDGGATFRFPDDGDNFFVGGIESIHSDSADVATLQNGGAWLLVGYAGRECGTKGNPGRDAFLPRTGKPDPDCDGVAEWVYGGGNFDEPLCEDVDGNGRCEYLIHADPLSLDPTVCPEGFSVPPERDDICNQGGVDIFRSSFLGLQRDILHPTFPTRTTFVFEETVPAITTWNGSDPPVECSDADPSTVCWCSGTDIPCIDDSHCGFGSTCELVGSFVVPFDPASTFPPDPNWEIVPLARAGLNTASTINVDIGIDAFSITSANQTFIDGSTGHGSPREMMVFNNPAFWTIGPGCNICFSNSGSGCPIIGLLEAPDVNCGGQAGDPEQRFIPEIASFDLGETWAFRDQNGRPGDPDPNHIEKGEETGTCSVAGTVCVRSDDCPPGESCNASHESIGSAITGVADPVINTGPLLFYGFRQRECGTTNEPQDESNPPFSVDPFTPRHGQWDWDCDRKATIDCPAGCTFGVDDPACPVSCRYGSLPLAVLPGTPGGAGPTGVEGGPELVADYCPSYFQTADTDSDGDMHGDQCTCGDQTGDGTANVSDILAINSAIFEVEPATLLCDANNDQRCNVGDILAVNAEIFSLGTSATCYRNLFPTIP